MPNTPEIHVTSYFSPDDGVCVVHIDTPGITEDSRGPVIRIYLNDEPVEENPGYPGDPLSSPDNIHRKINDLLPKLERSNTGYHRAWKWISQDGYIRSDRYAAAVALLKDLEAVV